MRNTCVLRERQLVFKMLLESVFRGDAVVLLPIIPCLPKMETLLQSANQGTGGAHNSLKETLGQYSPSRV